MICITQNNVVCYVPVVKPQNPFIYVANDVLVRAAMKSAARCGKALRIALFSESIEASTCIVQPVSSGCSHDSVPGNSTLLATPVHTRHGCSYIQKCVSVIECSMTQMSLKAYLIYSIHINWRDAAVDVNARPSTSNRHLQYGVRRWHEISFANPSNLSILVHGGKETKQNSCSHCE